MVPEDEDADHQHGLQSLDAGLIQMLLSSIARAESAHVRACPPGPLMLVPGHDATSIDATTPALGHLPSITLPCMSCNRSA